MKLKIKYLHSLKGRSIIVRSLNNVKSKQKKITGQEILGSFPLPEFDREDFDAWRPEPDYLRVKNGEAESPYLDERA